MNTKALVLAVTAACLTSGAAFAQSYDYRSNSYERGTQYQNSRYDRNGDGRVDRSYDRNGDGRVDYNYDRNGDGRVDRSYDRNGDGRVDRDYRNGRQSYNYRSNGYQYGSSYGENRYQMRRGEYLASQYRDRRYVVTDWRSRNLYQPQYGYQWVQAGNNDYALVAIATGLIAAVMMNH